jgi:hypothetical protein
MEEPAGADYIEKSVVPKLFTLAETNKDNPLRGGLSSANNALENSNGVQKNKAEHERHHVTQYLGELAKHCESTSIADLSFNSKMPRGYSKKAPDQSWLRIDKEVWSTPIPQSNIEPLSCCCLLPLVC